MSLTFFLFLFVSVFALEIASSASASQNRDLSEQKSYRDSNDIMRSRTAHMGRKLSATAHLPKRSTIVESPSGKTAQPTNVANVTQRGPGPTAQPQVATSSGSGTPVRPPRPAQPLHAPLAPSPGPSHHQQQQIQQQQLPNHSGQVVRPRLAAPGALPSGLFDERGQMLRPGFARNNTGVMIVDDSAPNSPSGGAEEPPLSAPDDGITLADIPQLIEAEEARKQHRALPSQSTAPLIAELTPLELMIVKHAALLALSRSPLKNEFELDDLLEFIEAKKGGFWNKLFKKDKQKKGS